MAAGGQTIIIITGGTNGAGLVHNRGGEDEMN